MEQKLTFDQLPEAVTMLIKEVSELKRLLIEKQEQTPIKHPEQLLTIQEAAQFLNLDDIKLLKEMARELEDEYESCGIGDFAKSAGLYFDFATDLALRFYNIKIKK